MASSKELMTSIMWSSINVFLKRADQGIYSPSRKEFYTVINKEHNQLLLRLKSMLTVLVSE